MRRDPSPTTDPGGNVALTRAAQAGDIVALGLLLEAHRPGMRAVALSILGPGPDADDAVQNAALTALRRIGDVRDPAAVGAWLRMIVRNACRSLLRASSRTVPLDDLTRVAAGPGPEEVLERHALRDWVWEALEELSPTLRVPMVLRHFSSRVTSYEEIARACAVPVGTIRSRLSQGRAKLAEALAATAAGAHSDAARRTSASWEDAHDTLAAAERGDFRKVLAERWSPAAALMQGDTRLGGTETLLLGMECDLIAGVRQRPVHVAAGKGLTVWEMDLINPPDDPEHCPPAVAWIMTLDGGRVERLRLFHQPRVPLPPLPPLAAAA
ncbi:MULTISPECIES: RNA polymerase sigma factor [unclassified Streptomyces]|uniref:RNA polymerase sigma factor n=1 Tax=unclassified Streptomyces TaxID=2593676 RepID=UPI003802C9D5